MLHIQSFVFNEFQENTYIIWDESLCCAIIDPGCYKPHEQKVLADFIAQKSLKPTLLLNTHCHIDHILGNNFVADTYALPLHLHEGELFTYKDANRWAAMFGIPEFVVPQAQVYLKEGDVIQLGQESLEVLFTPGHSIASISFYHAASNTLFSGDVLFMEGIGRTDLPGGNFARLEQSIRNILFALPDETRVFSGHGPQTRIGHEKKFNPFLG